METYQIVNDVSPRSGASMYEESVGEKLLAGQAVEVVEQQPVTEVINGESYLIVFLKLNDGRWIPEYLPYTGKYYAEIFSDDDEWPTRFIMEKSNGDSKGYVVET